MDSAVMRYNVDI